MIKGGLILTTGNLAAALLSLLRNIIIARLISVEDFGIASTFAITMALVEMASSLSLDRLLVQARDGEAAHFLSTLHAVQAIRGLLGGMILIAAAGPIAALFGVPEVAWAYQALALVPLLRGLAHLDMFRRQRAMEFVPSVTVEAAAQLLATIAALPLALGLDDYRAMLCALLLQQFVFTAASHWVANRSYRWAWDADVLRRSFHFGWPLFLNGFLMFGIFYGDRIIVGSLIGMTELGWFSAAFLLTLAPTTVLAKTCQSLFLPQLSAARDDMAEFSRIYVLVFQSIVLCALILALGFALAGPAVLVVLFGPDYEPAATILVWLAVMQALRVAKAGPAIAALARAETSNPLLANLPRVILLPFSALAVMSGGGILFVVGLGIIGEGLAFGLSVLLTHRLLSPPPAGVGLTGLASLGVLGLICISPYLAVPGLPALAGAVPAGLIVVAALPVLGWLLWGIRQAARGSSS